MKKLFALLLLVFVIFLSACGGNQSPAAPAPTPTPSTVEIYYTITASSSVTLPYIVYTRADGNSVPISGATFPYTSPVMDFSPGAVAGIMISAPSTTTVVVNIYKNGSLWKTNTGQASNCSVYGTI